MEMEQLEIVGCLVDNEIQSDEDYLNDVEEEEKEFWKQYIKKLKVIKKEIDIQISHHQEEENEPAINSLCYVKELVENAVL